MFSLLEKTPTNQNYITGRFMLRSAELKYESVKNELEKVRGGTSSSANREIELVRQLQSARTELQTVQMHLDSSKEEKKALISGRCSVVHEEIAS